MVDPNIQQNYQAQEDLDAQLNQVDPDKQAQQENLPSQISDLPKEITESYGTGVKDEPGYNIGDRKLRDQIRDNRQSSPTITGGDIDADWKQEAEVGDETPGGTAPTPDQDIVDEIGAAVGMEMNDFAFLRTNDMLEQRDDRRWELDPKSSEDYKERRE
ncbi:MAG: hypothetical protein KME28_09120 [Pelatocladus maniniholoensis HA4357-MV3]|jgi:hypothetical protein|uniref:Uncharacterized protein n=1 Tax=Pelatocladus maniniholoensis HA4357-MV3 TaxID=1117104 RepID=A0A9E3H7P8_9NOST|nr:hypothetical protein [Pelatocladus maniniholoensis HA4357-MV3]BAZ68331.1 hypothetical protein NIES4106_30920 [Fischerella sp. NIES-4106]